MAEALMACEREERENEERLEDEEDEECEDKEEDEDDEDTLRDELVTLRLLEEETRKRLEEELCIIRKASALMERWLGRDLSRYKGFATVSPVRVYVGTLRT